MILTVTETRLFWGPKITGQGDESTKNTIVGGRASLQFALLWVLAFSSRWTCSYNVSGHYYREVLLLMQELLPNKCILILLYAVEACHVNRSLDKSLQISLTRILMKIFKTRSSDIVMECQNYFGFYTISTLTRKRKATFLCKLVNSQNDLCELFSFVAQEEINLLSHT